MLAGLTALLACGFGGGPADRAIARQEADGGGSSETPQGRAVLTAMTIDGVTAYPMAELAPLYDDRLAREADIGDLVRVAEAITAKYRADGYFLTRAAAPYEIADGQGRLVVYEGYVGEIAFEGDAMPAVGALFADLPERRPLKLSDLDRRLSLAGDLPGHQMELEHDQRSLQKPEYRYRDRDAAQAPAQRTVGARCEEGRRRDDVWTGHALGERFAGAQIDRGVRKPESQIDSTQKRFQVEVGDVGPAHE